MARLMIAAALFATSATSAIAETTFDMTVTMTATTERQVTVFSEGHMAMQLVSQYDKFEGPDDNPLSGMIGTCSGHMIVQVPAASGSGLCTFSNYAGDNMVTSYTVTGLNRDGGISGTWTAQGGTGKIAGVQGGGSFVNSAVADDGTFNQQVTGAFTLP